MEVYSNSACAAILSALSKGLLVLARRASLVEVDSHLGVALAQFEDVDLIDSILPQKPFACIGRPLSIFFREQSFHER